MKELEKEFVGMYQQAGHFFGQDDALTTIYGILYLEPGELSMDELVIRTGYSLASVSNKIKTLESIGLVSKKKRPGSKKIFVYIEKDLFKAMKKTLLTKETQGIKHLKERLPEIIKKYKDKAKSENDRKKIRILEEYNVQIIKLEKLLQKMIKTIEELE